MNANKTARIKKWLVILFGIIVLYVGFEFIGQFIGVSIMVKIPYRNRITQKCRWISDSDHSLFTLILTKTLYKYDESCGESGRFY